MDELFLQIINMSITSSYVILFIIVVRFFLKKAPKIFSYALWAIPFLRLVVPFSFESILSFVSINSETIPANIVSGNSPQIQSGISTIDSAINKILPTADLPLSGSVNPMQTWISIGSAIWIVGIFVLLVFSIYSTIRLAKKLKSAKLIRDNIYLADQIETAFVFGLFRPGIFLPYNLSQKEESYIVKHEEIHIRRRDHIVKFAAALIVTVHWFNPLVWLAFFLMGMDMELSCDESVINEMGYEIRKDYSNSLLSLSGGKRRIVGTPIAFGENNTKGRIKNILNYKKPKFWIVIVSIILIGILALGLLSNRPEKQNGNPSASEGIDSGITERPTTESTTGRAAEGTTTESTTAETTETTTTEAISSRTTEGTTNQSIPSETTEDTSASDFFGEVSYLLPKIRKDTDLGATLPFFHYETEDQLIFSTYMGIFIYDLNNSKITRAFIPSDPNLRIGTQGSTVSVVQVDDTRGIITIHNVGLELLDYYYQYDINTDKLYKYPIEDLPDIERHEVSGEVNTTDWRPWNLTYTSQLTGKTYYLLRDIIDD